MKGSTHYRIISSSGGRVVFDDIPASWSGAIGGQKIIPGSPIKDEELQFRAANILSDHYSVIVATNSADDLSSRRKFEQKIDLLGKILPEIIDAKQRADELATKAMDRLLHNIVSLNAHASQDLYVALDLGDVGRKRPNMKDIVAALDRATEHSMAPIAKALLQQVKYNAGIKAEISVFQTLYKDKPRLEIAQHPVHRAMMAMLYSFFADFTDRGIWIDVRDSTLEARFDFDTFQVAIYHILENCTKYCASNSRVSISINISRSRQQSIEIAFDMLSLAVTADEIEKIFDDEVSGSFALQSKKNGQGFGMYQARRAIRMNRGDILFEADLEPKHSEGGYPYGNNRILIILPTR